MDLTYEQKKNLLYMVYILIVALLVFLSGLYNIGPLISLILAFLVAISAAIPSIFGFFKDRRIQVEREKNLENLAEGICTLLSALNLKFDVEKICEELKGKRINLTIQEVNHHVINYLLDGLSQEERDIIYILSLCREVETNQNYIFRSDLRRSISDKLSEFDLYNLDENTKKLLCAYSNLRASIEGSVGEKVSLETIFQADIELKNELLCFLQKYGTLEKFSLGLFTDLKNSQEFRRTLSKLLVRGKLPALTVKRKALGKIRKELEERGATSNAFVLFSNKFQEIESFEKALERFPQLKIGRKEPLNFPQSAQFLHMRVLYPAQYYKSAKDFLEKEIINTIPESKKFEGFVAVMPLEMTELASYPSVDEAVYISNDLIKSSFESINYLQTGFPWSAIDVVIESLKSEIDILELLSIIPFNIFVPDLKEEAKDCIIGHYERIQEKFDVKTLFDWADVNPESLRKELQSLPCGSIITKDEWIKVAKGIVYGAEKSSESTFGPVLKPVE